MQAQRLLKSQNDVFTISQVAHLTGVKVKAIRYYESIGLLPGPHRLGNQYRQYTMADANRLVLLRRIHRPGIPLAQARSLLLEATEARCLEVQQALLYLLGARLIEVDQEITALHRLRHDMQRYQQKLAVCHPDENETFRSCTDLSCIAVSDEQSERKEEQE